jgi:hypothetical protein
MKQPFAPIDLQNNSRPSDSLRGDQPNAAPSSTTDSQNEPTTGTDLRNSGNTDNMQPGVQQTTERNSNERGSQSALVESNRDNSLNVPPPSQPTTVRLSAPEIDWSYAVIERMDPDTLKTTLIPFDLGKLVMDHDTSQNLELKAGDVVSIFSQTDIHVPIHEQTKFVRLDGEFVHSGTYSVLPGETLRTLVQRAGGLTSNSYLYGSEFTRESTRVLQQRRIDESIQSLTLQMQRGNLALASSPITSPQDLGGMSSAQSSERELIAQLKQIRATGRIVLEFRPESNGPQSLPDIPLENGDSFLVPSIPSTVNVVDAMYN